MTKILKSKFDLSYLELTGFKSLARKTRIDFAALTILSGANSSGKSSVTQAILLLKQTIEAAYDPGALLLNGPNVKLTSATQLLSQFPENKKGGFLIKFGFQEKTSTELSFIHEPSKPGGLDIEYISKTIATGESVRISRKSTQPTLLKAVSFGENNQYAKAILGLFEDSTIKVEREKCFFKLVSFRDSRRIGLEINFELEELTKFLSNLVHVPGLRGNPERTYATTAISGKYPGRFESYVASLISDWEINSNKNFSNLTDNLNDLGLTSEIKTQKIDDTQVEIKVSRIKTICQKSNDEHLVSIADVGFGVSQVLPILVALTAANKGQYVIIEQPELHLHPKAQLKLASVIVKAVKKGVKVIIETHSNILIQGMQTIVARGEIAPEDIALNWFESDSEGYTKVNVGSLNAIGAFGDWPADFMDVQLESENEYLNAVEQQMLTKKDR